MNTKFTAIVALAATTGLAAAQLGPELTTNGDFEAGDVSGWDTSFLVPGQTFLPTGDANTGATAGELFNNIEGTAGVIKQANIGVGMVNAGDMIQVSFAAKGEFVNGGVLFAELFSEIDGGGTSSTEILGGAPLFVGVQQTYQQFTFVTTAGPDVSGGLTLQFNAATGAVAGSVALAFIDDVSVRVIPTPGAAAVLGLGGLAAMRRRRA